MHLVEIAVEPASKADQEALVAALTGMLAKDPAFEAATDPRSGETLLRAMDDVVLTRTLAVLRHVHGVQVRVGAPRVAFLEALGRPAEIHFSHKRQTHGPGQFAVVTLAFEPRAPGAGLVFESKMSDAALPREFQAGVEAGLRAAASDGLVAGFPLHDFKASLLDGAHHDVDSSAHSFAIAARGAFRELAQHAAPFVVEPMMRVEVVAPAEYVDRIVGDLRARDSRALSTEEQDAKRIVSAIAPLRMLLGFAASLRALAGQHAGAEIRFDGYARVDDPSAMSGRP